MSEYCNKALWIQTNSAYDNIKYSTGWNYWSESNSAHNNKVFSSSSTSPKFLPWQCFSRRVLEGKQMYFLAKISPNCHTFTVQQNGVLLFLVSLMGILSKYPTIVIVLNSFWIQHRFLCWDLVGIFITSDEFSTKKGSPWCFCVI